MFFAAFGEDENKLPKERFSVPVHWAMDRKRRLLYPKISKVTAPDEFSDALQVKVLLREL